MILPATFSMDRIYVFNLMSDVNLSPNILSSYGASSRGHPLAVVQGLIGGDGMQPV